MEQQERNGVNEARYAALELLEAELRDGNRAYAELAREELEQLRAAGSLPRGRGELRDRYDVLDRRQRVIGIDQADGVPSLEPDPEDVGQSGLWAPVELPADPRAMVS